jgi:(p)ppGpp synthase/HD superfamily hydrolase
MTLEQAIAFAALCHEGQKDKAGETYILHPLRVMGRLRTLAERRVKLADLADNMDERRLAKLPPERREALVEKYSAAKGLLELRA